MIYAYNSQGGFRTVAAASDAVAGEVVFTGTPNAAQLEAAFPTYAATLLAAAQAAQASVLQAAYAAACAQPVSFTTKAGVSTTFQADPASATVLQQTLAGLSASQATPSGFFWLAADNTQVPFAYADLQGLAGAMLSQGWTAFQHLQTQKAAVAGATTVAAAQAVSW